MRQRFGLIIFVVVLIGALVALNALSYVPVESQTDKEAQPRRSAFNAGASGTRAIYDFMAEGGYRVSRFTDPLTSLKSLPSAEQPATIVIIGDTLLPISKEERNALVTWVESGHRLVLFDRSPANEVVPISGKDWRITFQSASANVGAEQSGDVAAMTTGAATLRPLQPTRFNRNVSEVQPSKFASLLQVVPVDLSEIAGDDDDEEEEPPPPVKNNQSGGSVDQKRHDVSKESSAANDSQRSYQSPVEHVGNEKGALVVDYSLGEGKVVLITDPYIISNGGISRADNLQLVLNILGERDKLISFDEYHQGHGRSENEVYTYFKGTPALAVALQLGLIVLIILWTGSVRFGRPLPLPAVDRRSTLEFVSSMAELQQRSHAYDLAIENVYSRLRRVLIRYCGATTSLSRPEIAVRVANRSGLDQARIESVMQECEAVINGEQIGAEKALDLVERARRLEHDLGLEGRLRDERQEKII